VARNGTCTGGNRLHMVTGNQGALGGISLVKGIGNVNHVHIVWDMRVSRYQSKGVGNVKSMFASFESCESARYIGMWVSQVVRGIGQERRKQV